MQPIKENNIGEDSSPPPPNSSQSHNQQSVSNQENQGMSGKSLQNERGMEISDMEGKSMSSPVMLFEEKISDEEIKQVYKETTDMLSRNKKEKLIGYDFASDEDIRSYTHMFFIKDGSSDPFIEIRKRNKNPRKIRLKTNHSEPLFFLTPNDRFLSVYQHVKDKLKAHIGLYDRTKDMIDIQKDAIYTIDFTRGRYYFLLRKARYQIHGNVEIQ